MTHQDILIGYARTSTIEQQAGLDAQLRDLKAVGCKKLFREQTSSVAERAQLEAALDYAREGDTLVVTKLDRLARSARHLLEIVDALEIKGVTLRILNLGGDTVDTRGATGRLVLNVFAAFAQFEREMMLERQREGIAKAKSEGKYRGRKPTARAKADEAVRLFQAGQPAREFRDRAHSIEVYSSAREEEVAIAGIPTRQRAAHADATVLPSDATLSVQAYGDAAAPART